MKLNLIYPLAVAIALAKGDSQRALGLAHLRKK
jgi:hypothetical protein